MSETLDNTNVDAKEIKVENQSTTEDLTSGLRTEAKVDGNRFLKHPVTHVEESDRPLTAADVKKMAEQIQENLRRDIAAARLDPEFSGAQVVLKDSVKFVSDFSKMSADDVYDLSVPIQAKPFMSADLLHIKLKDTNYEARWVNINPQNLGDKIAKGFTYIVPEDLADTDEPIKAAKDVEGHYRFNDVVAMKIDKATYYRALRAAFERALRTVNSVQLRGKAAEAANQYMNKNVGSDYATAASQRKMEFYNPDVAI